MIGIIGGSGVEEISELADSIEKKTVETEYGSVEVSLLHIEDKVVAFLPRHSAGHTCPPHKINFKANIMALKEIGVNQTSLKFSPGVKYSSYQMAISRQKSFSWMRRMSSCAYFLSFLR